jgi:hypothetical protein
VPRPLDIPDGFDAVFETLVNGHHRREQQWRLRLLQHEGVVDFTTARTQRNWRAICQRHSRSTLAADTWGAVPSDGRPGAIELRSVPRAPMRPTASSNSRRGLRLALNLNWTHGSPYDWIFPYSQWKGMITARRPRLSERSIMSQYSFDLPTTLGVEVSAR